MPSTRRGDPSTADAAATASTPPNTGNRGHGSSTPSSPSSSSRTAQSTSSSSRRLKTLTASATAVSGRESPTTATDTASSSLRVRKGKTSSTAGGLSKRRHKTSATLAAHSTAVAAAADSQAEKQQSVCKDDGDLGGDSTKTATSAGMPTLPPTQVPHPRWVPFALFSGAFAAMNGVFAKLTTSSDEPPFTTFFISLLPFLTPAVIQIALRSLFFGLNIASNAVMWVLFTRALTSHPSTTKVSVVNTSANFALTAVMGALVFRESLGGIGGVAGLALLVAGCVILGAKKEKGSEGEGEDAGVDAEAGDAAFEPYHDDAASEATLTDDDLIDLQNELKVHDAGAILEGTESDDEELIDELNDLEDDA